MLIQCLIPRRDGSPVVMGDGAKVNFAPNDHGDHVCEVKDAAHIKQLLSHKGVYRPYNAEESQLEKEEAARQQAEAKKQAEQKPNPPAPHGDDEGDDEDSDQDAAGTLTEEQLNAMERDALADHFEKLTGKKPHHNTGKDKLAAAILAHQKKSAGGEGNSQ